MRWPLPIGFAVVLAVAGAAGGCGDAAGGGSPSAGGVLEVVAAESFWGSIARQLGGDRVRVTSIAGNPAADPHDYEPIPADARAIAGARLVILNGAGYDPWGSRLIAASPASGRRVLVVADLAGVEPGGNPHRWYAPGDIRRVVAAITAGYRKLDPRHAAYYEARRRSYTTRALAGYDRLISQIRRRYSGVAVGASESIFAPLAQALGLRLVTPAAFLNAVSEGTDPTAAAKATVDRQIAGRQIAVWVYNSQNATPDVHRLTQAARAAGIPVATVTETPVPPSARFQDWQVAQLRALRHALAAATGR